MKRIICFVTLIISVFALTSCSITDTPESSNSLKEIQDIVRETQAAFEGKNYSETQKGISKLVKISEDQLYSENERMISQYCAIYINTGIMLDYIIKNDKQWVNDHDVDTFNIFYGGIFSEVINGEITHNETLNEYLVGLIRSVQDINAHYKELTGK